MLKDETAIADEILADGALVQTRARDKAIAELFSPQAMVALGKKGDGNLLLALATFEEQEIKPSDQTAQKESDWFKKLPPAELVDKLSPLTDLMTNPTIVNSVRKLTSLSHKFNEDFDNFAKDFKARIGRDLVGQELSNPARMVELLRNNPALLNQYEGIIKEAGAVKAASALKDRALRMVAQDAQKSLNDICTASNLPPVKFEFSDAVTSPGDAMIIGASYKVGSAVLEMPTSRFDENLDKALTKKLLTSTLSHELDHHKQFCLVTAKTIAEITGNKPLGGEEIKTIQQNFKSRFGIMPERDFILAVEQSRKGHPLTEDELSQAKSYGQSFEKGKILRDKGIELEILHATEPFIDQRDAFEAFDLLNSFKTKQYLRFSPQNEITPLLEQQKAISAGTLPRNSWDEAVAKTTLKAWLTKSAAALTEQVKLDYDALTIEHEARAVGAEAAKAIP